jgi:hypothetical protein
VLEEIDPLPCAQVEFAIRDRYGDRMAQNRTFYVRSHIVGSFQNLTVL